ncbi:hypothetical protein BGZ76_004701 [Entomortierella beljakovae]|nr:hypothetical protein BGZ76_004701 [Entomortierella beljakovae]
MKELTNEFTTWKLNHSVEYWLDSASEQSTMASAEVVVKGTVPCIARSIGKYVAKLKSDSSTSDGLGEEKGKFV